MSEREKPITKITTKVLKELASTPIIVEGAVSGYALVGVGLVSDFNAPTLSVVHEAMLAKASAVYYYVPLGEPSLNETGDLTTAVLYKEVLPLPPL